MVYTCHTILHAGLREAKRFLNTKVMRDQGTDPDEPNLRQANCERQYKYDSDEYWECVVRFFGVTVYHPTSTCKMGKADDPTTVVDTKLRYVIVCNKRISA